jgi:8-oxo-dGTP pyrophosphatase MutT (NUDIX family)
VEVLDPVPAALRRPLYRVGYRVLQAFWFLARPRLRGVKCLITDVDCVLLVRHTYGPRWWDIPGGRIGRGEAPAHAAAREMAEELGVHAGAGGWEPIGELDMSFMRRRDTLHCFRLELPSPELRIDRGELELARWFARAELPYDMAPWVLPILARTTVRRPA